MRPATPGLAEGDQMMCVAVRDALSQDGHVVNWLRDAAQG